MTFKKTALTASAVAAFVLPTVGSAQPHRAITQIAEDLYWAENNNHRAVFLVTDEGVILADPINADFSTWLKAEIQSRFNVPVRYVLYSHHHWDHASGGAVFADTAQFVGHESMLGYLALPPAGTTLPECPGTAANPAPRCAAAGPLASSKVTPVAPMTE